MFEYVDEFHEVAGIVHAFREEMKMVRHEAKGMERKRAPGGGFGQIRERAAAQGKIGEDGAPFFAAYRDEADAAATIVFPGKAQTFEIEGHGRRLSRRNSEG